MKIKQMFGKEWKKEFLFTRIADEIEWFMDKKVNTSNFPSHKSYSIQRWAKIVFHKRCVFLK